MYFKLNSSGGKSAVFWERVPDMCCIKTKRCFPTYSHFFWGGQKSELSQIRMVHDIIQDQTCVSALDLMTGVKYSTFLVAYQKGLEQQ